MKNRMKITMSDVVALAGRQCIQWRWDKWSIFQKSNEELIFIIFEPMILECGHQAHSKLLHFSWKLKKFTKFQRIGITKVVVRFVSNGPQSPETCSLSVFKQIWSHQHFSIKCIFLNLRAHFHHPCAKLTNFEVFSEKNEFTCHVHL